MVSESETRVISLTSGDDTETAEDRRECGSEEGLDPTEVACEIKVLEGLEVPKDEADGLREELGDKRPEDVERPIEGRRECGSGVKGFEWLVDGIMIGMAKWLPLFGDVVTLDRRRAC